MTVEDSYQQIIGRYALFDEIAAGGMATVHIGRLLGPVGFSRTVAIKRLHPQFAKDPEFVSMFVDEARVAARIRHPNVVPTLDVVRTEDELFLVMEYVQGESLSRLFRQQRRRGLKVDARLIVPVVVGVLQGLHAAHNATGERGEPLHIVHRDVSPQNILLGTDGVPRVFDFGIAKARGRLQTTREGQIKGKLAYMAPEQLTGENVGPHTDVYAASLVLWEALAGKRLFTAENEGLLLARVLGGASQPPSALNNKVSAELDAIVMKGLSISLSERYASAREMAASLEQCVRGATSTELGEWVTDIATTSLEQRASRIAEIESCSEINVLAAERVEPSLKGEDRSSTGGPRPSQPPSQMSSISVTRNLSATGGRSRWALMAALVVTGGIGALAYFGSDAKSPPNAGHGVVDSPAEPTSSASTVAPVPSVSTSAAPEVAVSASAETAASASAAPLRRRRPRRPPPPPTGCEDPFEYDPVRKIKVPKPGCF